MATVRDIVTRACRKVGLAGKNETLDADMAQAGLDAFNEMLFGWKNVGVDVSHTEQTLDDTFALADQHREGTIMLLAARMAEEYEAAHSINVVDAFRPIQAAYMTIATVSTPKALYELPSSQSHNEYFGQ